MLLIKYKNTSNYKSHAPIDSLAQHSMIFTMRMPMVDNLFTECLSVLSGIPSFKDAFTLRPIQSKN
jgi:hypothetical protein